MCCETATIKNNSVLDEKDDVAAIEKLLRFSGAPCNKEFLPTKDLRTLFSPPLEEGEKVDPRSFTRCEDALILRGVSVYGERSWDSISSEFLPTRKMEMLNRRYAKLVVRACEAR